MERVRAPRPKLATGAALLLLVALAGCGEDRKNTIAGEDLESKLTTEIRKAAKFDTESVSCPEKIEAEKDKTVDCTALLRDGREAPLRVTLLDDKGRLELRWGNPRRP